MDLEQLKRFSSGELTAKQFLAIHRDAGELLDLLREHLKQSEFVSSVQDWPEPRHRGRIKQYFVLKTMMLITPLVLLSGVAFMVKDPVAVFISVMLWFAAFGAAAMWMLWSRQRRKQSRVGKSVLVATNRRLMRVWLDGSEEVQYWWLGEKPEDQLMDPVSDTIRLLLDLDLGKVSMN